MNHTVLITGASSGIGKSLCKECVRKGWRTIGVARSKEKLLALQEELGHNEFSPLVCDVADTEAVQTASRELYSSGCIPTLFFLNAGLAGEEGVEDPVSFDLAKHRRILDVNYFGVLAWVEFWKQICQDNGGATFVATSSVLAYFATPRAAAYCASKSAIAKAFEGLKINSIDTNLRFSVVYPGPVATHALVGKWPFTRTPEQVALYMIQSVLQGRAHCEPQLFYSLLVRLLHILPPKWALFLLKKLFS